MLPLVISSSIWLVINDIPQFLLATALTSTYYDRPEKERLELYRRIQPYLTFLDVAGLEQKHADSDSKIEALQDKIIRMEKNHKEELARIMSLIQQNPVLSQVKPQVLASKEITAS